MGRKNPSQKGKVYVVQDILDTKFSGGVQHYKVKWKGYPLSECTWEPEQSFNCSKHILIHFLQAQTEKTPQLKEKLQSIQKQRKDTDKQKQKIETQHSGKTNKIIQRQKGSKLQKQQQPQRFEEDSHQEQEKKEVRPPQVKIQKHFKILSIKKDKDELKFYVSQNGKHKWTSKQEMHKHYAVQLCQFYENHLTFEF